MHLKSFYSKSWRNTWWVTRKNSWINPWNHPRAALHKILEKSFEELPEENFDFLKNPWQILRKNPKEYLGEFLGKFLKKKISAGLFFGILSPFFNGSSINNFWDSFIFFKIITRFFL